MYNEVSDGKVVAASASVFAGPCKVTALSVRVGSADTTVEILDGGSAGTSKWKVEGPSASAKTTVHFTFPSPIGISNSLYVKITGTAAYASIAFIPKKVA